jgi:hypothetical protein
MPSVTMKIMFLALDRVLPSFLPSFSGEQPGNEKREAAKARARARYPRLASNDVNI